MSQDNISEEKLAEASRLAHDVYNKVMGDCDDDRVVKATLILAMGCRALCDLANHDEIPACELQRKALLNIINAHNGMCHGINRADQVIKIAL